MILPREEQHSSAIDNASTENPQRASDEATEGFRYAIDRFSVFQGTVRLAGWVHDSTSRITRVTLRFPPGSAYDLAHFNLPSPDVAYVFGKHLDKCRFDDTFYPPKDTDAARAELVVYFDHKPCKVISNFAAPYMGAPLSREEKIRAGFTKEMKYLEIGPSFNPVVPKRHGWNVFTVDHASRDELIKKYTGHPNVDVSRIEDVDFVWTGTSLDELIPAEMHGTFNACVASHVIEHIPDFAGFFVAASKLLAPGGVVALAVPDKRYCFDYFRPHSTTGQVLAAHRQGGGRHRPEAHFDFVAYSCRNDGAIAWGQVAPGTFQLVTPSLIGAWTHFLGQPSEQYVDCHGWQFTPSSFELIVLELEALGLIDFQVIRSFPPDGSEFIVQLRKKDAGSGQSHEVLQEKRLELLKLIIDELGEQADYFRASPEFARRHAAEPGLHLVEPLPSRVLNPSNTSRNKIWAAAKRAAKMIPPIRRIVEQRNQLAEELNQLTGERNKLAAERNKLVLSVLQSRSPAE